MYYSTLFTLPLFGYFDVAIDYLMLPVTSLVEPSDKRLLREVDAKFVTDLKQEIMENPTTDVQPILCIVKLKPGELFRPDLKEGYNYETVGGNNSREALQQLLSENPQLKEKRIYSHRLCAVYSSELDDKCIFRLAGRHNRATQFSHAITDWDKVCRFP